MGIVDKVAVKAGVQAVLEEFAEDEKLVYYVYSLRVVGNEILDRTAQAFLKDSKRWKMTPAELALKNRVTERVLNLVWPIVEQLSHVRVIVTYDRGRFSMVINESR